MELEKLKLRSGQENRDDNTKKQIVDLMTCDKNGLELNKFVFRFMTQNRNKNWLHFNS